MPISFHVPISDGALLLIHICLALGAVSALELRHGNKCAGLFTALVFFISNSLVIHGTESVFTSLHDICIPSSLMYVQKVLLSVLSCVSQCGLTVTLGWDDLCSLLEIQKTGPNQH